MDSTESRLPLTNKDALIIVDVQNDFLPGGALPIPGAAEIIAPLNRCIERFLAAALPIFALRDWHPPSHCSFEKRGGPWPSHCVAETPGAAFAAALKLPEKTVIVSKGTDSERQAHSAFAGTELRELLACGGVENLFVGGLAFEHGMAATVQDALELGFEIYLIEDAVRGMEPDPGNGDGNSAAVSAAAKIARSKYIEA